MRSPFRLYRPSQGERDAMRHARIERMAQELIASKEWRRNALCEIAGLDAGDEIERKLQAMAREEATKEATKHGDI
jgi:hypothetical protein